MFKDTRKGWRGRQFDSYYKFLFRKFRWKLSTILFPKIVCETSVIVSCNEDADKQRVVLRQLSNGNWIAVN